MMIFINILIIGLFLYLVYKRFSKVYYRRVKIAKKKEIRRQQKAIKENKEETKIYNERVEKLRTEIKNMSTSPMHSKSGSIFRLYDK